MIFNQIFPDPIDNPFIKSLWTVDSKGDRAPRLEKIIPDGYPEIIFHYGNPYRANISGTWENQEDFLLAGQIKNHFFLENTGEIGMIGIKLQPTTLYELFGLDMSILTNKVLPIATVIPELSIKIKEIISLTDPLESKLSGIQKLFMQYLSEKKDSDYISRKIVNGI